MKQTDFLFLDDIRVPKDVSWISLPPGDWYIVRSYNQFTQAIQQHHYDFRQLPSIISFDHDLNEEQMRHSIARLPHTEEYYAACSTPTGLHCARWLVAFCTEKKLDLPAYYCHSHNPEGKEKILETLQSFRRRVGLSELQV